MLHFSSLFRLKIISEVSYFRSWQGQAVTKLVIKVDKEVTRNFTNDTRILQYTKQFVTL